MKSNPFASDSFMTDGFDFARRPLGRGRFCLQNKKIIIEQRLIIKDSNDFDMNDILRSVLMLLQIFRC